MDGKALKTREKSHSRLQHGLNLQFPLSACFLMEATPGIEPGYADLQSDASPLRHVALDSCGIMIVGT